MEFSEYQEKARKTAVYPNPGSNLWYPSLGLCGEAGEIAEKVKRIMRDLEGEISEEYKTSISQEIGDVLWYLANIACELEVNLEDIAQANIEKLYSRKERGVLKGSGDDR